MAIIPAGYAQVNLQFTGPSAPTGAEMTFGFDVNVAFPPASYAESVADKYVEHILPHITDGLTLTGALCKFGPNDTGPSAEFGVVESGTSATPSVPPNVALLIRKATAAGGRAGRGRAYQPGIAEGNVDASGVVDPADLAVYQTDWDAFHAALVADGIIPVVLHGAGSPISIPSEVTSFNVAGVVATQRRRLRR